MIRVETPAEDAAAIVQRVYGLQVSVTRLPGEYDDNFLARSADGARYVLKIMHPARDRSLIDLQVQALQAAARQDPTLLVSQPVRGRDGNTVAITPDAQGRARIVWMLGYIDGVPYSQARPQTPRLRESLGEYVGRLGMALRHFDHPAAHRELKWDSARARWIEPHIDAIRDPARRALVQGCMRHFADTVLPALPCLRHSVIQGDANEYNALTLARRHQCPEVIAVIDFGDMHFGITLSDLTIAAAYGIFGQADALEAAADIVAGFHRTAPIPEAELPMILPLITSRLCVSVVNSALRSALRPDDPYMNISEAPAWAALESLGRITPPRALARFRQACGLPAVTSAARVVQWFKEHCDRVHGLLDASLQHAPLFDLSVASLDLGADPAALSPSSLARRILRDMGDRGASVALSRGREVRLDSGDATIAHAVLGLEIFAPAGTAVHAPLAAVVEAVQVEGAAFGLLLRHELEPGLPCMSFIGNLQAESALPKLGARIAAGGMLGKLDANGTTALPLPHLRLALWADPLGVGAMPPWQVPAAQAGFWHAVALDPRLLLPMAAAPVVAVRSMPQLLQARRTLLGTNLSLSYRRPLHIVRGWRQHLYDEQGRAYLDVFNNVPLVGHSHPRVVGAAARQLALLNTNSRYLHDNVLEYAQRLGALMPAPLEVCYFLNSASEANELALRIARTVTGRRDVVVLEHAYHGNTNTLIDISPYKFNGRGGTGRPSWVHVAPIPDDYRGEFRRADAQAGRKYADQVGAIIAGGVRPGAFIAETLPSVGGQVVLPPGYLAQVYGHVRAAGGLCIADEVQVGFGRLGAHFWGFDSQGVVPDIVVLGKPIGNAFPLAALVTTAEIAARFDNGMEFFSTFGGNPAAAAVGLAVLDVLRDEQLPRNAQQVGAHLIARLSALKERHCLVGDVRGMGLFLGVELVLDRRSLQPAPAEADFVVNRLREEGILAGTDGPHHNVIKIRPPLCIGSADADRFAATLDAVLGEDGLQASGKGSC